MATAKEILPKFLEIDGCVGACIVDSNSGMMLGAVGGGNVNLEVAAAGNTDVVRAKRKTMKALNLNESIEDILITLGRQYHLIRPVSANDALFIYVVLDRARSNLAMARHVLSGLEKELTI
ncbi:MAG: roadblock/LC7 domain-containing protein [Polyangiales bacterium]